ncbi:MAG: ANTAR domain-containing response regulator [Butyricicoccus sp.]
MEHVLIVTPTKKSSDMLLGLLQEGGNRPERIQLATSGSEARRALIDHDFDLILINSPLSDEFGHEFATYAAATCTASIVMLVKTDLFDSVAQQMEPEGIFILAKPISRPLFYQIVRIANSSRLHIMSLQKENQKLRQKLDDLRIISRAKCLLIQENHMTESEAHSYIEKNAMNHRKTRRDVAELILQSFE